MPMFTFYPTRADGLSATFETHELTGDDAALAFASVVLDRHESASSVVVYCGPRKVLQHDRAVAA